MPNSCCLEDIEVEKVAVFTSTRAEYGLLKPIILAIEKHPDLLVQLIVAGTHLSEAHGNTVSEIIDDGVEIAAKINVPFSGKSNEETVESLSQLIKCMPKIFFELKPDLIILLGDRFELLLQMQPFFTTFEFSTRRRNNRGSY